MGWLWILIAVGQLELSLRTGWIFPNGSAARLASGLTMGTWASVGDGPQQYKVSPVPRAMVIIIITLHVSSPTSPHPTTR